MDRPITAAFVFVTVLLIGNIAFAQEADKDGLNIEAQPLSTALREFSDQTGLQIGYAAELAEGKTTDGVDGIDDPGVALETLLASTNLEHRFVNDSTVIIRETATMSEAAASEVDSDSKNLSPTPILMAQASMNQGTASQSSRTDEGTVTISGKVTDARTEANLKGALVKIQETGQTTATDNLGNFRLSNIRSGSYTLRVSVLGYADQSVSRVAFGGSNVIENFALRGGTEIEEIVVFGQRSARAQALNLERSAENFTTVLSSDYLGNFTGTTISESLRRAPGLAFQQSDVTGEGTNVIVRGLAPDLNTVTLNGLILPEGSGEGRSADLSNILTESIAQIKINKTLLPNQRSSGTGGLIEIETKAPLDRGRRYANFSYEGGQRDKDFQDETLYSGTLSGTFGDNDNLGLSVSAQYRERDVKRIAYSADVPGPGQYLPLADDGTPVPFAGQIDPRTTFPFEPGVDEYYPSTTSSNFNIAETSNFSVTLSGQWQIADHTDLLLDFTRYERTEDSFSRNFTTQACGTRDLVPIEELAGELRTARVWEDACSQGPGMLVSYNQGFTLFESETTSNTYSLRGDTKLDAWHFNYMVGIAEANTDQPLRGFANIFPLSALTAFAVPIDRAWLLPEALNNTVDGRVVSFFPSLQGRGSEFLLPLLNQAGFDFFNTPGSFEPMFGSVTAGNAGSNERFTADWGASYNLDFKNLKYFEVGAFYESADFSSPPFLSDKRFAFQCILCASLADLGLNFERGSFSDVGLNGGFDVIRQSDIVAFIRGGAEASPLLTLVPSRPQDGLSQGESVNEETLDAYIQARVDIGNLAIVGGLRSNRVEIEGTFLRRPGLVLADGTQDVDFADTYSNLVSDHATQTELLPRLALTYRRGENFLFRFGYAVTVARPQIRNLSTSQFLAIDLRPIYGPNGNQRRIIASNGNPDLKPTRTNNYDLSAEYYFEDLGQIKASIFYKDMDDLLDSNLQVDITFEDILLPDDPILQDLTAENTHVSGTFPANSPFGGEIWGLETAFEKRLTFLPGIWQGLGVFVNYTYTDSERVHKLDFFNRQTLEGDSAFIPGPFTQDPNHSGTAALTYNYNDIDASLSFTSQDRRLNSFGSWNLSSFDERVESLDLQAEYRFEALRGTWRIWFQAVDLLDGVDDATIETSVGGSGATPKYFTGGNFFGGREYRLGFAATF